MSFKFAIPGKEETPVPGTDTRSGEGHTGLTSEKFVDWLP
jgi:hypothetical protein